MYAVSDAFLQAMKKPVQHHKLGGNILVNNNRLYFTEANVERGSFHISNACSGNDNVEIGTVYTAELSAIFLGMNLQRYMMDGAVITPYLELMTTEGYERVPLGEFNVSEANWTTFGIEVTAYDNMSKFEKRIHLNSNQYALTIFEYLSLAGSACGVGLAQTEDEIKDLPNGNLILTMYPENDMETWRDLVSWCAQTTGTFATIDRAGKLVLRAYGTTPVDTIDDSHRFTGAKFSDFETRYTGMSCVNISDQTTTYYSIAPDDALTYNLGSNPLLQVGDPEYLTDRRTAVLGALAVIRYVPMEVSMIGTPAYDLGDVLVFSDGAADENKLYCVTQYDWTFGGSYVVRGVGQNPSLASARSKTDKDISGLLSKTSENEICYYDYVNDAPYHIRDGRHQTIISIKYATVKSTHVDFHAEVKYLLSTTEEYDEEADTYTENDGILKVTYQLDDYEWTDYHPIEQEFDGTHLLHLLYTWRSSAGLTSEFRVILEVIGCEVWIEINDARAYIAGMGLVGDDAWDGSLKINQNIVKLDFGIIHGSFSDDVSSDVVRPSLGGFDQNLVRRSFFSTMMLGMYDEVEPSKLHLFSVPYNDNDVIKSNIRTSGKLWYVADSSDDGIVITPDCQVSEILSVRSNHTPNTGNVTFLVSFDSGNTWYMYASGWQRHESGYGMTEGVMRAISEEEWAQMITNGTIMVQAILQGDATLEDIEITTEVHQ